jgi:cysteine synthase A/cysteine synthase B
MSSPNHQLRVYESIDDLIASPDNPTPLIRLNKRFNSKDEFQIYLKLERYNPFGSVKDRIALSMLEGAEIRDGQSLVEPSSGNTGIALAALANAKGIPIEIAVPSRIPEEKKTLLRLLGIKALWEADDNLCPLFPNEGARGLVNGMLKSRDGGKYVSPNQYENERNVKAHYENTGPEIWRQTKGRISHFFAGVGTCGTITGVGRYLKEQNPSVVIVGVEPSRAEHNLPGMKRISDLSEEYIPKILDRSVIDDIVAVDDNDAYTTGIQLARKTGILAGPTTGAILHVAMQYAEHSKGLAVVISPDDAFKYMSFYAKYVKNASKPKV